MLQFTSVPFARELLIGLIDRPQEFVERRRLLDWPDTRKGGPENAEVTACEQSDCYDPFLSHIASR